MIWWWRRIPRAVEDAGIEEVAGIIHRQLTGRPEYKVSLLINAALQETLRKIFGQNGGAGSQEAVLRVVCEYLYCASCLTFSALSAAGVATAKEQTGLITKWNVEAVELLLLEPESVFGETNAAFRQMWDTLANEKSKAEQPSGYARPADAVRAYAHKTLPILAATLMPGASIEDACADLYCDMEYLLESLVFNFPELFLPSASVVRENVLVSSGWGLGLVQHYSGLDTRRAERDARRKAEQAEYCDIVSRVEKFVHSRRVSDG